MKNAKCVWVVIIGTVVALSACRKPTAEMVFEKLDPDFGGLQGGKSVRIMGDHIRLDIGYSVLFGKEISPQVAIASEKALVAVTPRATTPGPVDVTVRADDGSVFRIKQGFEYVNQGGNLLQRAKDSPPADDL